VPSQEPAHGSSTAPTRTCTHKIAIGESGRINVRFGALSGHKSDIVACPLSAISGHRRDVQMAYLLLANFLRPWG
jgi:hypothetical protein